MLARVLSAAVALPIALVLFWLGGWPFFGLLVAAGAVCFHEFFQIALPDEDRRARPLLTALGAGWLALGLLGQLSGLGALLALALSVAGILLYFLFFTGDLQTVIGRVGTALLGYVWVGALMTCLGVIRYFPNGLAWLYLACVLAWGSDTGAYFAGKALGRRKLYPAISPNKTWEGSIGGVLAAVLLAFVVRAVGGLAISPLQLVVVAALGAALGQLGDLAESMLKRAVGVKDSGAIMPGHGGLLDRLDALMFVGPVVLAYLLWAGQQPTWLGG